MMRQDLPDLIKFAWRLRRLTAALTAFAFLSLQLFAPAARAEDHPLPNWLKEEEGGWLSADQARRMQHADRDLLAHLSSLADAQERYVTTHPSGLQVQFAGREAVVARDAAGNLLWEPTLDDYRKIQNGTLLLVDGTLQAVRNGRLSRQVAADGTETVYRADGRADHETAADGTRTDYSYSGTGFTRTTHLPNGDLVQSYDAQGRLTRAVYPGGKEIDFQEGLLTRAVTGPWTYDYARQPGPNGTVRLVLAQISDAVGAIYTGSAETVRWWQVEKLYRKYLAREPALSEAAYWVGQPLTPAQIESSISGSPEGRRNAVRGFYRRYLNRDASDSEVKWWASRPLTLAQIENSISGSPEGRRNAVREFYRRYLNRNATDSEAKWWASRPLTLAQIESSISGSPEGRRNAVRGFYQEYLGRAAEKSAVEWWANQPLSLETIRNSIRNSAESKNRPLFPMPRELTYSGDLLSRAVLADGTTLTAAQVTSAGYFWNETVSQPDGHLTQQAWPVTPDQTAPAGTLAGPLLTNQRDVTLTLAASDPSASDGTTGSGGIRMRFSLDGGKNWSLWEPFAATKQLTLPPIEGQQQIRAQFQDAAGNISAPVIRNITLDTAPPVLALSSPSSTDQELYTAQITADGTALPSDTWRLGRGTHQLIGAASDPAGNSSWARLSVTRTGDLPTPADPPPEPAGDSLTQTLSDGSVATSINGQLTRVTTTDGTRLIAPTLDSTGKPAGGWLITPDGTTTYLQGGLALWSRDPSGAVTWYFSDGRPEAIRGPDGALTAFAYRLDAAGQVDAALITTGQTSTLADAAGQPVTQLRADGSRLSYSKGRLSLIESPGRSPIPYTETVQPDGSLLSVRPEPDPGQTTDLPRRFLYAADGTTLLEVTQADQTLIRFANGIPSESVAPDGTVTTLAGSDPAGSDPLGFSVLRAGITRTYDAAGRLKQLTLPDKTTLKLTGDVLQGVQLPDGTTVTGGVYDADSRLLSGTVTMPDGRKILYAGGQPAEATLADGSKVAYANGQPSQMTLPGGNSYTLNQTGSDPAQWVATLSPGDPSSSAPAAPGADVLTSLTYSSDWVLQQATRADGAKLEYRNGKLDTLTQAGGTVISYAYDDAGHLTSTVAASPDTTQPAIRSEYAYDKIRKVYKVPGTAVPGTSPVLLYDYSYEFPASGGDPGGTEITAIREISTGLVKRYRAGQLISQTDPDGAVTTYEYTTDPAGYSDPLQTATEMTQTLPGGTVAHYQPAGPGAAGWSLSKLLRSDGTELTAAGRSVDTLTDGRGVGQAPGKIGSAAEFHHADWQYLTSPDTVDLSMGRYGFTFSTWVYMDSKPDEAVIFHKGRNTQNGVEYVLTYEGGATDRFRFVVQDGTEYGARTDGHGLGSPQVGQWYFITCWFDPADHYIKMQINNGGIDTAPLQTGSYDSNGPFRIGDFNNGNTPGYDTPGYNSSWDGRIDELGIWKRVLTDPERAELYHSGQGDRFDPSSYSFQNDSGGALTDQLVTYYTLDEPSGSRADSADLSGLLAQAALPTDRVSLRRMAEQGVLSMQGGATTAPSATSAPVLLRSTVTYQGKVREQITYHYAGGITQATDESGTTRSYDSSGRLTAVEQADGTRYDVSYDQDLDGSQVVIHHLATAPTSGDTVVEEELDASGNLLSRTQANGEVTLYDHGQPVQTLDAQGNVTTTFGYDSGGRLIKVTLVAARRQLAGQIAQLKADIPLRRSQALEELARQKGIATDQVAAQFASARSQLQDQLSALGHKLDDTAAMKAHGNKAKRQKSQALDQIRAGMNEVRDARNSLETQYAQALGQLQTQVESVRSQIDSDSSKALAGIADKETQFGKDILRQEISTIVISAYRSTIGRDPSGDELRQEAQRLYDRYGNDPSAAVDLQDLTQRITALPDYAGRAGQVSAIKQQVTDWLTRYAQELSAQGTVPDRVSSLGLTPGQAVPLSASDIQRILDWLNSRPLHFGHSAFLALQEYLSAQNVQTDLIALAAEAILTDILIGVITPKADPHADLQISLFTLGLLARRHGAAATAAQVAFGDLKPLLDGSDRLIAHVNGNHYIVLISVADDGTVTYREPNAGPNGQTLTMTQADFQKIWRGVILTPRAPPHPWQVLTDRESQRITGAFFPLIFLALAWIASGIGAAISAVVGAITTLIAGLGSLISGIFSALGAAFSSIGSFFGGFGSFFSGLGAISQGLGGIFAGNLLGGLGAIAEGLTIAIPGGLLGAGLNIGVTKGLEALGVSSTIASLAGAFVSGGVTGALNPVGTTSSFLTNFATGGLTSAAIAGTQIGLVKAGLDPDLAGIASIGIGTIAGSMLSGVQKIDPVTGKTITVRGFDGLSQTLHTTLAPTMAGELAFYGVQKLGQTIGLDPRISQLAGIPVQNSISTYLSRGTTDQVLKSINNGLAQGATNLGLEFASQELNLDPLISSIATAGITGSIETSLEGQNPLKGAFNTYFNSVTGLLTLGGPGTTPLERAVYLSKVNDFSKIVREQGIGKALETYVISILQRQTIENIWKLGGIYDLLANRNQIEIRTNDEGIGVERIYTDIQKRDYIDLALDDNRLVGMRENNVIMHCEFAIGPDGKTVMRNGEKDSLSDDGTYVARKDVIKDFKLVGVTFYDPSGSETEEIVPLNEGGITIDKDGNVVDGIRINKRMNITAAFLNGRPIKLTWTESFTPSTDLVETLLAQGFTKSELGNLTQIFTYVQLDGRDRLTAEVVTSEGNIVMGSSKAWPYLTRALTGDLVPEPRTTISLDRDKSIAQVNMNLLFLSDPALLPVSASPFLWIAFHNIEWSTFTRDTAVRVGSLIGNGDASFVYIPGANDPGFTLDQIAQLKASLGSDKKIVVGDSAGTEAAVREMFTVKADKYILASPRMDSLVLANMIQEAGVKPDQVIVITTRGDFPADDLLGNAPYVEHASGHWISVHIEDGPGVSWWPFSSHKVPMDGWLSGKTYHVSINGEPEIKTTLTEILKNLIGN